MTEAQEVQASLRRAAALLDLRERERDAEVARADAARLEAEEADQTKDHFLALLGHELRNPLAPVVTALEVMKLRDPGTFARERSIIERQVTHMTRLVNDLLDVSRVTRGVVTLRPAPVEVGTVVERAVEMTRPLYVRHQHTIRTDVPPLGLCVHVDADRMVQVLTNLLANAALYTPAGGRIRLSATADGDTVRLACEDNGPGIPDALLPTLFQPFRKGGTAGASQGGGLGLGLALARSLVGLQDGQLEYERREEGGSRFVITLPRVSTPAPAAMRPQSPQMAPTPRRVLIVDDNRDAAEMLRAGLSALGHTVAMANDGVGALATAAAFQPEVAVLDIRMPGMTGYELAQRLRATQGDIRLVALTGYGQRSDEAAARAAGFDRHCTKPVTLESLLASMEDEPTSV